MTRKVWAGGLAAWLAAACIAMAADPAGPPVAAPQTQPASQPASRPAAPALPPVEQWFLSTVEAGERLTDTFGAAPQVAIGRRAVHVFSASAPPPALRTQQVDTAAAAEKVIPKDHPASLRSLVVHWVDAAGGRITSATLDVGAVDGFRDGIFSWKQMMELVEVQAAPAKVLRFEAVGNALPGAAMATMHYDLALGQALRGLAVKIAADPDAAAAIGLEWTDLPADPATVPASGPAGEPASKPASQPASQPAAPVRRTCTLGGLTLTRTGDGPPVAAGATGGKDVAEAAFATIDALAGQGVCVLPVSAADGKLTVAGLVVCRQKEAQPEPPTRPTPTPEPEPDDETPLPRID